MKFGQAMRQLSIGLLLATILSLRCNAVLFVATGDPAYNTNAPTGTLTTSGLQYEGQWGTFLATPIAPNFFVAAKHVGGAIGQVFTLNGVAYHTTAVFDGSNTDVRLWQVMETFPSYAPMYTNSDEVGKPFVVFGRGTDRGGAVVVNNATKGWQWGSTNNIERWGQNVVGRIVT